MVTLLKGRISMKKTMALLTALLVLFSSACAGEAVTANGVVKSKTVYHITAPFTGVLKPFDWENGDEINGDDVLFEMHTTALYAPVDGTVRAVFAKTGDLAETVLAQYGALAVIEKADPMVINASIEGAYDDPENRRIHAGETVYFEQNSDRDNEGEGRVIAVSGKNYTVEITAGDFEDGDDVTLYRDVKMGTKSDIGSGEAAWAADVNVNGSGYVLSVCVGEGDEVRKGDVLMELVLPDADNAVDSPVLYSPASGALELNAASGMQVYKGQLLAKVHDLSAMTVVASVDEMDLGSTEIGQSVTLTLDRYPNEILTGTVTEISRIGTPKQNASYYDVAIELSTNLEVLPGMNATVYLTK